MDSKVLVGIVVGVWAKVFSRVWEHRGDGGELKVQRECTDNFVLGNSSFCCLVIDGGVQSRSLRDRRGREQVGGGTKGVI